MLPIATFVPGGTSAGPPAKLSGTGRHSNFFPELLNPRQSIDSRLSSCSMAEVSSLPTEVLREIVSYITPDFADLWQCSLLCRAFWEVATTAFYADIDLRFEERGDEEADEKTQQRQLRLIRSLAE